MGVTGQRRMHFPPWRLNLPLTFFGVVLDWVGDCFISVFSMKFFILNMFVSLHMPFSITEQKQSSKTYSDY